MDDRTVALLSCAGYERELVEDRVGRILDLFGGPAEIVGRGGSVFVKVNALLPSPPERGVTTNPEVVRALVLRLKEVAGDIVIGDSPGGPFTRTMLKRTYEKCGFARVAEETGVRLSYDTSVSQVALPDAGTIKSISISGAMKDADSLVSVSKFKTHMLVNITAAVKNLFGAVPGMVKFSYHSRFADPRRFAGLLVDVMLAADASFHLVDAIDGMEGNGPRQGEKRHLGLLGAGKDALSLDSALMDLLGLEPGVNLAVADAIERGICSSEPSLVPLLGDDPATLRVTDFRLPDRRSISSRMPSHASRRFANLISLRPRPDPARCTGCRKCAEVCPENAIHFSNGRAVVDLGGCIRCYCCHELCEDDAIDLEKPLLMKVLRM